MTPWITGFMIKFAFNYKTVITMNSIAKISLGIGVLTLGFMLIFTSFEGVKEEKKPNLIYIFPDQYRLYSLGIWKEPGYENVLNTVSDPVFTPNLDKLAKESLIFTQASSTHPVCSPHRAMFMSGMYSSRNGVAGSNCAKGRPQHFKHEIKSFTHVLAEEGYETAYVGKVHWEKNEALFDKDYNYVGTTEAPGGYHAHGMDTYVPPGPGRRGNKYWYQLLNDQHFNPKTYSNVPDLVGGKKDGQVYYPKQFTTILEADAIVKFLENRNNERDPNKPFSVIWAPNPPHSPYTDLSHCETEVFNKYYKDMSPSQLRNRPNITSNKAAIEKKKKNTSDISAPIYFSNVHSVDREIGRVLKALEAIEETENTVVVFTTDHGELLGSHGTMGKNTIYNESFLVPFLIRYPRKIKNRLDDLLLETVDIMPTLLGLMGMADKIPGTVDGTDFSHNITSGKYDEAKKPKSALYLHRIKKGIRTDKYIYQVNKVGETELYDNEKDPYQMNNLSLDNIPEEDLKFLQSELGRRLMAAGDAWGKNKMHADLIKYPK